MRRVDGVLPSLALRHLLEVVGAQPHIGVDGVLDEGEEDEREEAAEGGGRQAREVTGGERGEGGEDVLDWGGKPVVRVGEGHYVVVVLGAFD